MRIASVNDGEQPIHALHNKFESRFHRASMHKVREVLMLFRGAVSQSRLKRDERSEDWRTVRV
ncbi:hypothetical protein BGW80DRAFT_1342143, partial [Lactifluus volemus]